MYLHKTGHILKYNSRHFKVSGRKKWKGVLNRLDYKSSSISSSRAGVYMFSFIIFIYSYPQDGARDQPI